MKKILLIEDEESLQITIRDRLVQEGYEVEIRGDGLSGLEAALSGRFDGVILDLMLPGIDGIEVCARVRRSGSRIPILMATARGETEETISGLRTGADDYLVKPFDLGILTARVEALLRRAGANESPRGFLVHRFGPFVLDEKTRTLRKNGEEIPLFAQEYRLLNYFLTHSQAVLNRDELLKEVWDSSSEYSTRTVDVHVAGLRQKLGQSGRAKGLIQTVWKQGYLFSGDPDSRSVSD